METPKHGFMLSLQCDVFEVLPNGSEVKRASVTGIEAAWQKLRELAEHTTNECFAIHTQTRHVVAQINVPVVMERGRKLIFQIAYTEALGIARSEELTRRGYRVMTGIGNENAKAALRDSTENYDLFIVAHAAPGQTREAMVSWLRVRFPNVKILGLNPINQRLRNADYNVLLNGPETWVPFVARALA